MRIEGERRPDAVRGGGPFLAGRNGVDDTAGWHTIAAGKRSLQLDVRHPDARGVVADLVR